MATLDSPHLRHLLRAELDRRHALAGLAGVTGLVLAGRRRAAAQDAPPYIRTLDLARAALRPDDLADGGANGWAFDRSITYHGLSGAFESAGLDEADFAVLEQAGLLEEFVGGHRSTFFPRGDLDTRYETKILQFASVTAARAAMDPLAESAGDDLDEITPDGERSRFFREVFEDDGDLFDVAVVVFRRMEVVVAITCEMEFFDDDDGPTDGEIVEALTAMSARVQDRLDEIVGGDDAGIGATLPTPTEFSGRAGSLVPTGRGWRQEAYTLLDGGRVEPPPGLTTGFPPVDDDGAGVEEAVSRLEEISTYEGKKVVLGTQARRFASPEDVAAFLARALAGQTTGNEVAVEAIDPPAAPAGAPFLPGALTPRWTANRFSYKDRDLYGVTAWVANDRDLVGVQVAGVPTDGAEAALTGALRQWVWVALGLYELATNLDGLAEQEVETRWRSLYNLSPELCDGLVPLDFLD